MEYYNKFHKLLFGSLSTHSDKGRLCWRSQKMMIFIQGVVVDRTRYENDDFYTGCGGGQNALWKWWFLYRVWWVDRTRYDGDTTSIFDKDRCFGSEFDLSLSQNYLVYFLAFPELNLEVDISFLGILLLFPDVWGSKASSSDRHELF